MTQHGLRILKSIVSLPLWVQVWMLLILIPANVSGLFFLETTSGQWIALLGSGALAVNTVLVLINGGFTRVLALPHLLFWIPLEMVLLFRMLRVEMDFVEFTLTLAVLVVNAISLVFDGLDAKRWYSGEKGIIGMDDEPF
ncbi:MAG: hypothetical protein P1V21_08665 [Rhizobiaceae bacterium]|nr:hypothetical protein [Rhizobiaceae bacterium]